MDTQLMQTFFLVPVESPYFLDLLFLDKGPLSGCVVCERWAVMLQTGVITFFLGKYIDKELGEIVCHLILYFAAKVLAVAYFKLLKINVHC